MKTKIFSSIFLLCLLCVACNRNEQQPADYVNPFIGASTSTEAAGIYHGLGKTFPGAAYPFGLAQVSPQTITGGDNEPGYSNEHTSIEGFSFTQMSGTGWAGDLGNLLITPTTGALKTIVGKPDNTDAGYRSKYDKTSEKASAGYYSVLLTDFNVKAEATVAAHGGMLRFTFPENQQSRIQIDLARRVGGTSVEQYVQVLDKQSIRGWMKCTAEGGGWGNGNGDGHPNYTVYFYVTFSRPFDNYGFWNADIPDDWKRKNRDVRSDDYQQRVAEATIIRDAQELQGKHTGFFAEYATANDESIEVKAGISFVDMEGAEKNFRKEIINSTFDEVHANVRSAWNEALSKVAITGGSDEQKTVFYTALYHTMIDPRVFTDVDGRYYGGDGKVHQSDKFNKRTIFSGWDVFRSQFPLQTLINPTMVNDEINSFITLAEESGNGFFERWEFLNSYSRCMVGNPAVSVLADAYMKGIRDYDIEKAYQYAINTCDRDGTAELGYYPQLDTWTDGPLHGGLSQTLEYAYSDWCMAQLAKALGKTADYDKYMERAQAYRNIFDPSVGWFRPKRADGTWLPWTDEGRLKDNYGSVETNPYQQGWFVPHDIDGMVALMGGKEKTLADLTEFFEKSPSDFQWNSYYNHANEPVHHVPFLFNRLGEPWKTQYWTRFICEHAYLNKVEGLVGNEDIGQMSAWYVLAASGIHPVCPGDVRYEITSPVFDKIVMKVGKDGKSFTIKTIGNSPKNVYIQSAKLNGKTLNRSWLAHDEIISGGSLELTMGDTPNKQWGSESVFYTYTLSAAGTKEAYDEAMAVACIQGIVNRGNPSLYVLSNPYSYTNPAMFYWDLSHTYSRPDYWLDAFSKDGEWLAGKKQIPLKSLDALINLAKDKIKGVVIWDTAVPATINVATTMAGVEDLVVLSPEIADKYLKTWKLPVIKDLRGVFTGKETGSKKNDAYRWAIREYVETGKCNPQRLFSNEDAATAREKGLLDDVVTRDWAVYNRSFVYDLSPWNDEALDDMEQPVGTDFETHKMLLSATMKQAKGEQMTEVAGFSYFFKYCNAETKPKHEEIATEWEMIHLISAYNCYQNTLTEYSYNQSFHSQAPDIKLEQGRPTLGTPKDGKTYLCFLMADYDSSTPLYDFLPNHWNDSARGQIPLTWGIDPTMYEAYPDIIQYVYKTKSPNDFFAADASAAGYMNPNRIDEANLPLFVRHNKKHYEKLDMSLSPMVLDWDEPTAAVKDAFTQFSSDGYATIIADFHKNGGKHPEPHVWKGMPVMVLNNSACNAFSIEPAQTAEILSKEIPATKGSAPTYSFFRVVWVNPTYVINAVNELKKLRPELDIEVVDPYNFFHYFKTTYSQNHKNRQ